MYVCMYAMCTVTFPWQQHGLQSLSIQRVKSEFPSFKNCYLLLLFIQWVWVNIWTFHSRSTRKSVRLWRHFSFWEGRVWKLVCCCGDIISNITMCTFFNLAKFQPCLAKIQPCRFIILYFVISHHFVSTLWHHKSSDLHKSNSWISHNQEC